MTALKRRLVEIIDTQGPIPVSEYMALCLFDPTDGYYITREPFGSKGDFVTAPEISQMFGELVAVWACSAWLASGKPAPVTLAEIGPGRGTLMVDMLRTLDRLDPGFVALARVVLVEASPRLTELQKRELAKGGRAKPRWFTDLAEVPAGPLLVVANELFDALPARQFVRTAQGWNERMVTLDDQGELAFALGHAGIDPTLLPDGADAQPEGTIFEIAPAREAMMDIIAARIARDGGAALLIDYGHLRSGFGDTLQAVLDHGYDPALSSPGEADLTSHVDFARLIAVAQAHGLQTRSMTQGEFLVGMGLLERAGALGAKADEAGRERLQNDVERLAGAQEMGELFKVLMIAPQGVDLVPTSTAD